MKEDHPARILVADDDAVSLQFLVAALRELGCVATGVANGREASAACKGAPFDLMLLDRRMPDLGGAPLLRTLRRHGCATVAIATSAELDSAIRIELADAGYADAVTKPVGTEILAALLRAHVPRWRRPTSGTGGSTGDTQAGDMSMPALLEDEEALVSVGGDRQTLRALRGLFAKELESMLPRVADLTPAELGDWLHRLRASCRYCGAVRLLGAVEKLELRLKRTGNRSDGEWASFVDAIASTIFALDGI